MRWWHAQGVLVRDMAVAAGVVALTLVPGTGRLGAAIGDLPARRLDWAGVALAGLLSAPLLLRRLRPGWCLALVGGGFCAYELAGYTPVFATLGLYVALYAAGAYVERGRAWIAAGAAAGYLLLAAGLRLRGSPDQPSDFLLFFLALAACWAAGAWMRDRREAEAVRRADSVAAAMSQERARIARELHDIVTHHVTAMVIQADAATYLVSQAPDRAMAGLTAIGETGRRALADLRDLLAVLRTSDPSSRAPTPGELVGLADLVERMREAGQPVELIEEGAPRRSSDGVELAAYRVAQESLTNALKHAPGSRTVVRVGHHPDEVRIEVTTAAGPDRAGSRRAGTHGYGLLGLAERVGLYGGDLQAGPTEDGAFRVRATIPRSGDA
ncbi:two-component sensor histidine kinase [Streptosporangiaceae bacterium NEAU-GS5]|nr:two-component sensor histidine kinase [Streptosporangiaceae bacterium NEAU-GS5]